MAGEKRRAIGKWAAVALVFVLVAYPLSFGPYLYVDFRWVESEEFAESPGENLFLPCLRLYYSSSLYASYIDWWVTSAIKAEQEDFLNGVSD